VPSMCLLYTWSICAPSIFATSCVRGAEHLMALVYTNGTDIYILYIVYMALVYTRRSIYHIYISGTYISVFSTYI